MKTELDTEVVLAGGGTPLQLMAFVDAYESIQVWSNVLKDAHTKDRETTVEAAQQALADLPDISDLDGLRVTTRLIRELSGGRWLSMRNARENGVSWDEIAKAAGMSVDEVCGWYTKKIEAQEEYCAGFHDVQRARAALDE